MNPLPSTPLSETSFATTEAAAITDGSSIAIGTTKFLPLTLNPVPRPKGMGIIPMQFSIMLSASSKDNPPSESTLESKFGSIFYSFSIL